MANMKFKSSMLAAAIVCTSGMPQDSLTKLQLDSRQIEIKMYEWYVKHYTNLDYFDIEELKKQWDNDRQLEQDPNIQTKP